MLPAGTIEAVGLHLVRTSALVLASPILGTAATASGYKIGLIASLTLLFYLAFGSPLAEAPAALVYVAMATRELIVGLFLAFVLHAVMLAVRVAGELVGNEMGLGMANSADPISGASTPIVAQLYEILLALALLRLNGHHWLLRALAESFERAPVGTVGIQPRLSEAALGLMTELFSAGLAFSAPLLVVLFISSVLIGLLGRTVPQLNIMEFGFNIRIGVALLGLLAFAPMLAPAMDRLLLSFSDGLQTALDAIGS